MNFEAVSFAPSKIHKGIWKQEDSLTLTTFAWVTSRIIAESSVAAFMHLSSLLGMFLAKVFDFPALAITAWCKQMIVA